MSHDQPFNAQLGLSRSQIRALAGAEFKPWFFAAVGEWTAISVLCFVGLRIENLFAWILITILIGSRQHALGVLGHDAAHFTAASSRKLNDVAGELFCFWPLFTGLYEFRAFHLDHHRFFGTNRDPELLFKHKWSAWQWSTPKSRVEILILFLGDLLGLGIFEVAKAFYLLGRVGCRGIVGPLVWWIVVGSALWSVHCQEVILVWLTALLTSFWGFFRLRTWTEHVGSESTHIVQVNWWQKILITPHCSWTHAEHHDYPYVPFWKRHLLRSPTTPAVPLMRFFSSFEVPREPDTRLQS